MNINTKILNNVLANKYFEECPQKSTHHDQVILQTQGCLNMLVNAIYCIDLKREKSLSIGEKSVSIGVEKSFNKIQHFFMIKV